MQLHNTAGSFHDCIFTPEKPHSRLPEIWIKDYKDGTVSMW